MTLYRHVPGFGLFKKEFSRENSLLLEIEQLRAQIARLERTNERLRETGERQMTSTSKDESGWLIELGRSPVSAPEYWCGNRWSTDHMQAIRFARKVDAERTAAGWDDDPAPEIPYRICEHGWS